jgi:hypothetical protein
LSYSQNGGDGSGGGGGGQNSGSLVTKVQMENLVRPAPRTISMHPSNSSTNKRVSTAFHVLINIYSFINAYDRCILTLCCSSLCWNFGYYSCSCCQADGQRLESTGNRPEFFRSDRGSETMLLANVQLQFKQFEDPNATIDSCSRYGTSKSNS